MMYKPKELTNDIQLKIKAFIGREISIQELKFLPYFIANALCNDLSEGDLEPHEKELIESWIKERLIIFLGYQNIKITDRFFKTIFIALRNAYAANIAKEDV